MNKLGFNEELNNKEKSLILFDLDKTLSDVWWYTDTVLKKVFDEIESFKLDNIIKNFNSINSKKVDKNNFFKFFIQEFRSPIREWGKIELRLKHILWDNFWEEVFNIFKKKKNEKELKKQLELFSWIDNLLQKLKNDINKIIWIVTNKEKKLALDELEYLGIKDYFDRDLIITSSDVKNQKPDSSMLELISLRAKLSHWENIWEIIMIGDSQADMNAWIKLKNNYNFANQMKNYLVSYSHTPESLKKQKNAIEWKSNLDYIIVNTVEDLNKILYN